MESQQKKKTGKGSPSGKVWLAGAGPGDASLLTLKVKKMDGEADVIIYDALISAEILSLIPDGKRMDLRGKNVPDITVSVRKRSIRFCFVRRKQEKMSFV